MKNKSNSQLSQYLDIFVAKLLQNSAFIHGFGFLTGKTGIAVLLYHYARYKQDAKMLECADCLLNIILDEISIEAGFNFENGISGTAWAINRLLASGMIQVDDDVFEDRSHRWASLKSLRVRIF